MQKVGVILYWVQLHIFLHVALKLVEVLLKHVDTDRIQDIFYCAYLTTIFLLLLMR